MKIIIIPSWYPTQLYPESGSFFRDRAQILTKSGMDIVVAAPVIHYLKDISGYFNTKSNGYFCDGDIPIYKFEFFNIFPKLEKRQYYRYKKNSVALFNRVIKDRGMPDEVFVHSTIWAGAALADVCRQYKIPIVISEHLKEFLYPDLFSQFQQTLIETTYQSCSSIISTSTALRNSIVRSYPQAESKISIIPNPVDEDIFVLKPSQRETENTSILCISLFRSEKRIDLVIQSFYELLQSGEKATLTIVGDGPLKSKLTNQIQELDISSSVKLKGYLSQKYIIQELHNNDFLVLASDMETFGVVLLEAQACGLPVVATDCGGPSDIVSSDTGILVKPGSSQELTKGLIKMMNSINNYKPDIIRKKTIDQFGKYTYIDAIEGLVNKIISHSS